MSGRLVRDATPDDAAAIAAIYAPYVENSAISFEADPPDAGEMRQPIERVTRRHPWLVAVEDGVLLGYAYGDLFRTRAAYRWAVETTVYVDEGAARHGIGLGLYTALLDRLRQQGFMAAIGVIALPNAASVALHEAMGFTHVGTHRAVGYKLGRWHDVGHWQCELAERPVNPEEPSQDPPYA